jgi:hypothetical protein
MAANEARLNKLIQQQNSTMAAQERTQARPGAGRGIVRPAGAVRLSQLGLGLCELFH